MRKKIAEKDVANELIPGQSAELLRELHLLTRAGDLNADARRKLKQINHFVRFLKPAIREIWQNQKNPVLVDVASGNAYLGFILYEVFFKNTGKGRIIFIDSRAEFLERGRKRAEKLGFERMEFQKCFIQDANLPQRVHLITALHACDTATDDAILCALEHKIDHAFFVPCCQAEAARLLAEVSMERPLSSLFHHGYHRREFASHLTNVLRVLVLEALGYKVKVTELASWEHTAKGELIIGKRVQQYNSKAMEDLKAFLDVFPLKTHLIRLVKIRGITKSFEGGTGANGAFQDANLMEGDKN